MKPVGCDREFAGANSDAAGFVLAGGQSSRMGQDKALVNFAGEPLIVRSLRILHEAGLSASIAGARSNLSSFASVVPDPASELGPLSGVCAALASTSARYAVFVPIDQPFLPSSLLVFLLHHARITGRAVTIPSVSGFDQTFPAVLDRAVLPTLQSALAAGRGGCLQAFQAAATVLGQSVSCVPTELFAQTGHVTHPHALPPYQWFYNVNSPVDLERAEAIYRRRIA